MDGFAIAAGFGKSKLTKLLGDYLGTFVDSFSPMAFNYLLIFMVTFLTEITSNTATCNVMMPILSSVAYNTLTHPMLLLAPAAAACSFAFMTPVATPPNAVVFATGRLKFKDFLKAGWL